MILSQVHPVHTVHFSLLLLYDQWTDLESLTTSCHNASRHHQDTGEWLARIEDVVGNDIFRWWDNALNRNFIRQRKYQKHCISMTGRKRALWKKARFCIVKLCIWEKLDSGVQWLETFAVLGTRHALGHGRERRRP